jgi:hypothetical protein
MSDCLTTQHHADFLNFYGIKRHADPIIAGVQHIIMVHYGIVDSEQSSNKIPPESMCIFFKLKKGEINKFPINFNLINFDS